MIQIKLVQAVLVMAVVLSAIVAPAAEQPKRIVFIAGKPSHGPGQHEYNAGCLLLKQCLDKLPQVQVTVYTSGWPTNAGALDGADAVVIFADGGPKNIAIQEDHLAVLAALAKRGGGIGCMHYALEVPKDNGGVEFQEWIGGYYETLFSCNPFFEATFDRFPDHPIARGVKPFSVKDEWYFNMRFRPDMKGVTPILVTKPSNAVRKGPYSNPKGPYDHIVAASGREEVLLWAAERPDGGRGAGFSGGHYHTNWGDPNFRKVVLNTALWLAKLEVPANGVESDVTADDLKKNLDVKVRKPAATLTNAPLQKP